MSIDERKRPIMPVSWRCSIALSIVAAVPVTLFAAAPVAVTVHFYERPPYASRQPDGSVKGLTANPVLQALATMAEPYQWSETPAKRQLSMLEHNSGRDCGIGWFRNPDRERFAKFSVPIYRDLPPVAIVNPQRRLPKTATVAEVLATPDMRVLIKDGLTYGGHVGGLLKSARAQVEAVSLDSTQIIRMVAANRADMMFATGEEAPILLRSLGDDAALQVHRFPEIPAGEHRYLMCSKQVDDAWLARFNKAILRQQPAPR